MRACTLSAGCHAQRLCVGMSPELRQNVVAAELAATLRESCLAMDEHRKACRRFNEAGHAHALTFSCFCRRPFLSKDRSRMWLVEAIDQARQIHAFDLWAYVVMPEHAHLLLLPRKPMYSISRILTSIKRPVSRKALSYVRTSAPNFLSQMEDRQPGGRVHYRFWQRGGGYDRNVTGIRWTMTAGQLNAVGVGNSGTVQFTAAIR